MASAEILAIKKERADTEFQQSTGEKEVTAAVTETTSTEENDSGMDNSSNSPVGITSTADMPVMQEAVTPVALVAATAGTTAEVVTVPTTSPFHVLPANYQLLLQQQYINFLHLQQQLLQVFICQIIVILLHCLNKDVSLIFLTSTALIVCFGMNENTRTISKDWFIISFC